MRNMYVPMLEINIRRTIGLDLARFWIALSTTMFIKGRIARSRPTKYGRQLLASKRIVEIMRYKHLLLVLICRPLYAHWERGTISIFVYYVVVIRENFICIVCLFFDTINLKVVWDSSVCKKKKQKEVLKFSYKI